MQTNCLTEAQLMRYLNDEVTASEARQIDRHLAHCALCSDAMEGALSVESTNFKHTTLNLDTHFKQSPIMREKTLQFLAQPSRRLLWGVAASFALVASAVTAYFYSSGTKNAQATSQIAQSIRPDSTTVANPIVTTETANPTTALTTIVNPKATTTTVTTLPAPSATAKDSTTQKAQVVPSTSTVASAEGKNITPTAAVVPAPAPSTEITAIDSYKKGAKDKEEKKEVAKVEENAVQRADPTANYQGASNAVKNYDNSTAVPSTKLEKPSASADYERAIALYNKGKYQKAINEFNVVLAKQNEGRLYHDALWYTANSYLKLEKQSEAKKLLKRIISEKGVHAQEAEFLYKD
jgi:TolA-binding protein